jgi:hypothetical protein
MKDLPFYIGFFIFTVVTLNIWISIMSDLPFYIGLFIFLAVALAIWISLK